MRLMRITTILTVLLTVCICVLFAGCGNEDVKNTESAEAAPDEDYEDFNVTAVSSSASQCSIAAAEGGFYFISGFFVFYYDFSEAKTVPLCSKVNCRHHKEDDPTRVPECDAFIGSVAYPYIGCNHGKLYVTVQNTGTKDREVQLLEMNADGSGRNVIIADCSTINTAAMRLHRGILYYAASGRNLDGKAEYYVKAVSLKSTDHKETLIYTGTFAEIEKIIPYGDYVYFSCSKLTDMQYQEMIMRYSIPEGNTTVVTEEGYQLYGARDQKIILLKDQYYYLDNNSAEISIQPYESGLDTFKESHPGWSLFVDSMSDSAVFLSCLDMSDGGLELVRALQVVDNQGNVICEIPDEAHGTRGSQIIRYGEEEYYVKYADMSAELVVSAYKMSDLRQGVVQAIPVLRSGEILATSFITDIVE